MSPAEIIIFLLVIGAVACISGLVLIIISIFKKSGKIAFIGVCFLFVMLLVICLLTEVGTARWKVGG